MLMESPELQSGVVARVYRALFTPRLPMGLPREMCSGLWGLVATAVLCFHRWWVLPIGVVLHAVLAYLGRNNPYWFRDWRRKYGHADTYEAQPVVRLHPSPLERVIQWLNHPL
jgi:type IV secretory pathway TrbD component